MADPVVCHISATSSSEDWCWLPGCGEHTGLGGSDVAEEIVQLPRVHGNLNGRCLDALYDYGQRPDRPRQSRRVCKRWDAGGSGDGMRHRLGCCLEVIADHYRVTGTFFENLAARAWSLGRHLENTGATGTWSMEQDDVATPSHGFCRGSPWLYVLHRVTMPFARPGCLQGRGPAKSIQLVKMSYENKVTRQALKKVWSWALLKSLLCWWMMFGPIVELVYNLIAHIGITVYVCICTIYYIL